jgi:DNA-binding response OmpR family regulator
MKILIVEDEVELRETMVSFLEEDGFRCEQAGTFELGTEKVNLYEYDCLLVAGLNQIKIKFNF